MEALEKQGQKSDLEKDQPVRGGGRGRGLRWEGETGGASSEP